MYMCSKTALCFLCQIDWFFKSEKGVQPNNILGSVICALSNGDEEPKQKVFRQYFFIIFSTRESAIENILLKH